MWLGSVFTVCTARMCEGESEFKALPFSGLEEAVFCSFKYYGHILYFRYSSHSYVKTEALMNIHDQLLLTVKAASVLLQLLLFQKGHFCKEGSVVQVHYCKKSVLWCLCCRETCRDASHISKPTCKSA